MVIPSVRFTIFVFAVIETCVGIITVPFTSTENAEAAGMLLANKLFASVNVRDRSRPVKPTELEPKNGDVISPAPNGPAVKPTASLPTISCTAALAGGFVLTAVGAV